MIESLREEPISVRLEQLRHSAGLWHGLIMTGSTLLAGTLDYLFNVFSGRLLLPVSYGALVAVLAILQILLHATNVIRNVVAYYSAEITVENSSSLAISAFLKRSYRWSWRWGIVAAAVMALLSPRLASLLQLPSPWPLWAASLALLMFFVRPVTDGALQGIQRFGGLAAVTVFQASLRLLFALVLIALGWEAFGAVLALPMATGSALLLALWYLRPEFRTQPDARLDMAVSRRYATLTLAGFLAFALLTNMDAIAVKINFPPEVAANYAPIVTLGKINLFVPLAIGMVLFPKAVERHVTGRDARPIMLLALVAALTPGLLLTAVFFIAPGPITQLVFGDGYSNLGPVLGFVGLATTLFAGISLWLNFALSTERPAFIYALVGIVVLQAASLFVLATDLQTVALVLVAAGLVGNIAGLVTTWRRGGAKTGRKSQGRGL